MVNEWSKQSIWYCCVPNVDPCGRTDADSDRHARRDPPRNTVDLARSRSSLPELVTHDAALGAAAHAFSFRVRGA
jgi:hypothetical protein